MKSTIFWNIIPCSPLKVNWCFWGTYCLHLQSRISRARYQRESRWQAAREGQTDIFTINFPCPSKRILISIIALSDVCSTKIFYINCIHWWYHILQTVFSEHTTFVHLLLPTGANGHCVAVKERCFSQSLLSFKQLWLTAPFYAPCRWHQWDFWHLQLGVSWMLHASRMEICRFLRYVVP
jgi:hypothetical protein